MFTQEWPALQVLNSSDGGLAEEAFAFAQQLLGDARLAGLVVARDKDGRLRIGITYGA